MLDNRLFITKCALQPISFGYGIRSLQPDLLLVLSFLVLQDALVQKCLIFLWMQSALYVSVAAAQRVVVMAWIRSLGREYCGGD